MSNKTKNIHTVDPARITIDAGRIIKNSDHGIIGIYMSANPTSWTPKRFRYGYSHISGLGVWDIVHDKPVTGIEKYVREMGIKYIRFPGGFGDYNWRHAVGPIKKRPHIYWSGRHIDKRQVDFNHAITFGLPEFLFFCDQVGAEPVIGISEYPDKLSIQSVAEMVEYLNSPCSDSCTTGITNLTYDDICLNDSVYFRDQHNNITSKNWAQVRVCDKYALGMDNIGMPWKVKWFEYGNESYRYYLDKPEIYINNYLLYQSAMQRVDRDVKLGAVIGGNYKLWKRHRRWNYSVIPGISKKADFFIVHKYIPRFRGCCERNDTNCQNNNPSYVTCSSVENLFSIGLAGTTGQLSSEYKELNDLIYEITGDHIPVAVTEFGGLYNESDFNYYGSFGNALILAEHIKQLMLADNIALATYHHLNLRNPGVIKGLAPPYKIRPVYYVFQFYNKHFGKKVLNAEVVSESYQYSEADTYYHKNYRVEPAVGEHRNEQLLNDVLENEDWNFSKQPPGVGSITDDEDVLTINFSGTEDVFYHHAWKDTKLKFNTWYRLSGLMKTIDLTGTNGEGIYISVESSDNLLLNSGFEEDSIKKKRIRWDDIKLSKKRGNVQEGTTAWKYITVDFKTKKIPDEPEGTANVGVYLNRDTGGSKVSGKVMIKDMKLRQLIRRNNGSVPYLSVNASRNDIGDKVYLMVTNKNMNESIYTRISTKSFIPSTVEGWTLYANSIDATDEVSIKNAGFEDEIDFKGWFVPDVPGVKAFMDKTVAYSGNKSLKINFNQKNDVNNFMICTRNFIKVKPNTAYRLEFYYKTKNYSPGGKSLLFAQDMNDGKYEEWATELNLEQTDKWRNIRKEFITSERANQVSIGLKWINSKKEKKATGTIWIDHIILSEVSYGIKHRNIDPDSEGFYFEFPKHSLTALEISGFMRN